MPADKISVSLPPTLVEELDLRDPKNRSGAIASAVERHYETCRRYRPDLTIAEWSLVCDALNGVWLAEPVHLRAIPLEISDAISMNRLAAKWGISASDADRLVKRVAELDWAGLCAVADVVERFWADTARTVEDVLSR